MHRIYLLPRQPSNPSGDSKKEDGDPESMQMVYAPVPLASLPLEMQVQAMEAWVQRAAPPGSDDQQPQQHMQYGGVPNIVVTSSSRREGGRHSRRRSGSSGTFVGSGSERDGLGLGHGREGRIRLAVQPEEGLLPSYSS